jgi:hypothetical protein
LRLAQLSRLRLIVVTVGALALGAGVYAYAASNTVPSTTAGAGSGTISGYTVSNVAYGLNATTPTNLDQVTAQLASAGTWYSCANTAGSVTCNTTSPQATVAAATQLTVVATQ